MTRKECADSSVALTQKNDPEFLAAEPRDQIADAALPKGTAATIPS
jgi:hypothetical protein